jgi:hypothetical protein
VAADEWLSAWRWVEGHLGDSVYHGASESGHSSPGGWGSGWEEDDEKDASEQDDEPSEGSVQPFFFQGYVMDRRIGFKKKGQEA